MSRMLPILVLAALLAATVASADGIFHPSEGPVLIDPGTRNCRLGNDDVAGYQGWYAGFWDDEDAYAYLIDPRDASCGCTDGAFIQSAWFGIVTDPSVTLNMRAELYGARDGGGGCMVPDGPLDISFPVSYTGGDGSFQIMQVPFGSLCFSADEPYFVVVRFLPPTPNFGTGVPVDDTPAACEGYVYRTGMTGWIDPVVAYGWVGNFYLYADLQCCTDPVGLDQATWGALKSMYR